MEMQRSLADIKVLAEPVQGVEMQRLQTTLEVVVDEVDAEGAAPRHLHRKSEIDAGFCEKSVTNQEHTGLRAGNCCQKDPAGTSKMQRIGSDAQASATNSKKGRSHPLPATRLPRSEMRKSLSDAGGARPSAGGVLPHLDALQRASVHQEERAERRGEHTPREGVPRVHVRRKPGRDQAEHDHASCGRRRT